MAPYGDVVPSQRWEQALAPSCCSPRAQCLPSEPSHAPWHCTVWLRRADDSACWVAVPPVIEPSAVDLTVLENGTASLECLASGLPAPGELLLSLSSCSCILGASSRSPWSEEQQHSSLPLGSLLSSRHHLVQGA